MITEPKWKSLTGKYRQTPIFTPAQCQDIINMGHQQKKEEAKSRTVQEGTPRRKI